MTLVNGDVFTDGRATLGPFAIDDENVNRWELTGGNLAEDLASGAIVSKADVQYTVAETAFRQLASKWTR